MKNCFILVFFLIHSTFTYTQRGDTENLSLAMDSMIERLDSTFNSQFGMGIVVVKNDVVVYEKYKGFADIENIDKVIEGTEFYLSSITKSFTAMAALLLHEKGQCHLDTGPWELEYFHRYRTTEYLYKDLGYPF